MTTDGAGMPRRPRWVRWALWAAAVLVVAGVGLGLYAWLRPAPALRISPETTYYTEPLLSDGTVDYVTILNRRLGEGISPDENAAVLILQIWDIPSSLREREEFAESLGHGRPSVDVDRMWATLRDRLGVSDLEPIDRTFVGLYPFLDLHPELEPDCEQWVHQGGPDPRYRPWRAEEHPATAAWLEAQADAFALARLAADRPRWFVPILAWVEPERLYDTSSFQGAWARGFCVALVCRAMLHGGQGRAEDAIADLITVDRLATHLAAEPTLTDHVMAIIIRLRTSQPYVELVESGLLDADGLRRLLADFSAVPPLPDWHEVIHHERLAVLSAIAGLGVDPDVATRLGLDPDRLPRIDRNALMIEWNAWCDRLDAALRQPDYPRMRAAVQGLMDAYQERIARLEPPPPSPLLEWLGWDQPEPDPTRTFARDPFAWIISSATWDGIIDMAWHERAQRELTRTAIAVAGWREEHGRYPEHLDQLVPGWLPAVPLDPFTGEPLQYQATEDGAMIELRWSDKPSWGLGSMRERPWEQDFDDADDEGYNGGP